MAAEKNEIKKYPEPIVGAVIFNKEGEILLIKSPKWGDFWQIPGGHIEIGETANEALKREIKEETGLEIGDIQFLAMQDVLFPKEYYQEKHFIFLDFCAKLLGGEIVKSEEMFEYKWLAPDKAIKKLKISPYSLKAIQGYLKYKERGEGDYLDKPSDFEALEGKYKRALADYQNLLKQTAKEKEEFAKFANKMMILNILPIYDHLKMALTHADGHNITEGIKCIISQFREVLKNFGVEEIRTIGEKFNHNEMEAVQEELVDDEKKEGIVASELLPGYKLNGKVIKAARVAVYKIKN